MPSTLRMNTYNVKIQRGIIERLGLEILRLNDDLENEILLVTDEENSETYLQKIIMNLQEYPKPEGTKLRFCEVIINSQEESKNFHAVSNLLEKMASLKLSKKCIIAALGNDVVCSVAGVAAMCCSGGARLVPVPVTLSAMIEVSSGGTASLNLNAGKNFAGITYKPSLVLCDTDCVKNSSSSDTEKIIKDNVKLKMQNIL